jgi:hypothetical protein
MPDPILALANFEKAAPFTLAGDRGRVVPQLLQAGARHHHSRFFYVELPLDSGRFYQIDAARLVGIIGDGGVQRHFSAADVASILAQLSPRLDHHNLLAAVSINF